MPDPQADPLTAVLDYLDEIGYRDLYLRQAGPTPVAPARAAGRSGADDRARAPGRPSRPAPSRSAPSRPASAPAGAVAVPDLSALDLDGVATVAAGCTACRLSQHRRSVVFGSGNPDADLMFIGEGPGEHEDHQGLPFVGPAGELLTRIIEAIDLHRDTVYITNTVKCRPPSNRNPRPDEVAACSGFLARQIDLVQPKVIVLLGKVAAQAMLGLDGTLDSIRGRWHTVRGVQTRVTYHPAALLRNQQYKRPTWEDMQIVRDHLRALPSV